MMLAGNHIECGDEVYSYADLPSLRQQTARDRSSASESKQSATSDISQPLRNSQTRRALRVGKGSVHTAGNQDVHSPPYDTMGNVESDEGHPVSYHAGAYNTHVGQFITGVGGCDGHSTPVARSVHPNSTVTADNKVTKADKVQLGDYTFPPDQRKESIEGIRSPNPTEYCDPYETESLSKLKGARFTQNAEGLRRSLPATLDDQSDIYELATAIPDSTDSVPTGKGPYSARNTRLHSEGSQTYHSPLTRCVSEPVPQEELDEYDHLSTWVDKTGRNKTNSRSSDSRWGFDSGESMMATVGPLGGDRKDTNEQVYGGAYEEPWDTRKSKQHFSDITDRAQNLFDVSSSAKILSQSSDDTISGVKMRQKPNHEIAVYEDAWDTPENQKMFEMHVQDVQMRENLKDSRVKNKLTPEENEAYEEPWKASEFIRSPAAAGPQRPSQISPAHNAPQVLPGAATMEREGGDTYESPWDTKKMEEKVQRVSLQHSTTHTSAPSSPGSPPNFFAPKVPDEEYQEAWDTKPSSDIISRSAGGRRVSTGRTDRGSTSREPAEKIDPSVPLDIQKFYHGGITRKQAEDLMTIHREGSYLIRRSETQNNVFSLSLKGARGMPMHIRIGLKGGEYILGENSQPFPTVPEVIDYYTRHELPVQGAGRLRLLYPIMRDK